MSRSYDLEQMTVPELKALAKDLGIDGAERLKKADLIDAIIEMEAGEEPLEEMAGEETVSSNESPDASEIDMAAIERAEAPQEERDYANKDYSKHSKFDKFKKGNE